MSGRISGLCGAKREPFGRIEWSVVGIFFWAFIYFGVYDPTPERIAKYHDSFVYFIECKLHELTK